MHVSTQVGHSHFKRPLAPILVTPALFPWFMHMNYGSNMTCSSVVELFVELCGPFAWLAWQVISMTVGQG